MAGRIKMGRRQFTEIMIREANYCDDLGKLQEIMKSTFTETFGKNYPENELACFLETAYSVDAIYSDLTNCCKRTYLFENEEGKLMGYAMLHFGSMPPILGCEDDITSTTGDLPTKESRSIAEIQRFYFIKQAHGLGFAATLMKKCLSVLQTQGYSNIWLGVWEENFRALNFYERFGFRKLGIKEFKVGSIIDRDFILNLML